MLVAFKYLTAWSLVGAQPAPERIGKSAGYFPVVGFALGLPLALVNYVLAPYVDPGIINVVVVATLIAATGGQHLHGAKAVFPARVVKGASDDSPHATLGLAAVVLLIFFKIAAAHSMDEKLTVNLLLMPVLARWALIVFLYGYGSRLDDTARRIAESIGLWAVLLSTAATLAALLYVLGRNGLWIALAVSTFALCLRATFYRIREPIPHAHVRGTVEFTEALTLVLLASL